jgi:hypothetical protein
MNAKHNHFFLFIARRVGYPDASLLYYSPRLDDSRQRNLCLALVLNSNDVFILWLAQTTRT